MAKIPDPAGPDAAKVATATAASLGAMFTLGALVLYDGRTALSVGAGAVIAVANLVAMNVIVRAMLRQPDNDTETEGAAGPDDGAEPAIDHAAEGKRGGAAWGAFALVKILMLFAVIWLLLSRGVVAALPLALGYGVLPLGITVGGLFSGLAPRPRRKARQSPAK